MSYPEIIKEAALEKMFHTDLSLRHISDQLGFHVPRYMGGKDNIN